ncbi:MAG: AGE family epimerase/isomerase, partial [Terrabacter sp.]
MADAPPPPADHLDWLDEQRRRMRVLVRRARNPAGGFGWLTDDGDLDPGKGVELWITARMTHVAALAVLEGDTASADLVDHGVATFASGGLLHDPEH